MRLFSLCLILLLVLTGCHSEAPSSHKLKVGTIAGPETELMEVAQQVAKQRYGLNFEIVTFDNYIMPNEALANGDIDANVFQHQPYLQSAIQVRQYPIQAVGRTFIYPMGIYSSKIKDIKQVPAHSVVAIPNDPSNAKRALLLLQQANLITLHRYTGFTQLDIGENPLQLNIKPMDAAQLTHVLSDVDLAVINTNYAMVAGLLPSRDALILESSSSPYANLIVVRKKDSDNPQWQSLIAALHSPEVVAKAKALFKGQAIPAW